MLTLMKNFKTLSMVLLAVLVASLSGCASNLPAPPKFPLYIHNQPKDVALCSVVGGGTCPAIPMDSTHKFFMLSPESWEKLQNYIDSLIRAVQRAIETGDPRVLYLQEELETLKTGHYVPVNVEDFYTVKKQSQTTAERLRRQVR